MNLLEIQKVARKIYGSVFALEKTLPHKFRKILETFFRTVFALFLVGSFLLFSYQHFLHISKFSEFEPKIFGITSILFAVWIIFFALESFYYSHHYLEQEDASGTYIDFDTALVISKTKTEDVTASFFGTLIGETFLLRCGISTKIFDEFLRKRKNILLGEDLECKTENNALNLKEVVLAIIDKDKELEEMLFAYGIQKKEASNITDWIVELNQAYKNHERWWSKQNLGHIQGLGQDLSYGQIFTLKKYEKPLLSSLSRYYNVHSSYGVKELKKLEAVLSRSRDANAILIGDDEAGLLNIVSHFSQMVETGYSLSQKKHKRLVVFDGEKMVSANGSKTEFESEFIKMMQEAIYAGNIVLVIEDMSSIVKSVSVMGVDLLTLIEQYLSSKDLQIIATTNTEKFHKELEHNSVISQHFENILVKDIDDDNTIKVLENEIVRFERQGLFFTYTAVSTIATSAERYFSDGVMPDKAIDLLLEIVPKLISKGKRVVEKKDVLDLIETKTGIPVGEVGAEEKQKLLNLEKILHERIVGQDEAIASISDAVRRARSGVGNPDRPFGSFLFLGPTGVGKTETTKALANVFFGEKVNVLRLDMSEYSSDDAVSKLIGSFEGNRTGVLSTMLREHPYGVLLLDEFEKTTKEVMNLFLQILDEGFFSDNFGKKIGARNLIIIATSNAGSEMIWETVSSNSNLAGLKDRVVDNVIKQDIFKPELLNRFDGVILFHPLDNTQLRKIAELMLNKLHERLAERGINLTIDETIINFVITFGTDPKFGARPMNRAIQEKVEEVVAKKIISGSITKGAPITLTAEELSEK